MSHPVSSSPSSASRTTRTIAAKPAVTFDTTNSGPSLGSGSGHTMASTGALSNGNSTSTGTTTGSSSGTDTASVRAPFVFQFSAATEMILKRLRGEGGLLNPSVALGLSSGAGLGAVQPPGYEDVRRSVLQGMKTTLNMDIPTTTPGAGKRGAKMGTARMATPASVDASGSPAAGSVGGAGSAGGAGTVKAKGAAKAGKTKAGTKRKRVKDESDSAEDSTVMSGLGGDSDSDGTGSVTHMPTKTLSGRKVVKPAQFDPAALEGPTRKRGPYNYKRLGRNVEQALCKRCGRGHSPASNMIVFCDGCNMGWHQMCHDPMVSDELVKDESKEWFCKDCSAKRTQAASPAEEASRDSCWLKKGMEERRAYLSAFPQSHLVSLLLQATTMHPDIPIFPPSTTSSQSSQQQQQNLTRPADRRLNVYPQQPFPPSATSTAGLFSRAEANPSAPINFIRKIAAGGSASPSSPFTTSLDDNPKPENSTNPPFQHASTPPALLQLQSTQHGPDEDAEGEEESRESTPASPPYPRPGNGLMAKLPPDDQDLEWLVGEGEDDAAFSHVVFDADGAARKVDERAVGKA